MRTTHENGSTSSKTLRSSKTLFVQNSANTWQQPCLAGVWTTAAFLDDEEPFSCFGACRWSLPPLGMLDGRVGGGGITPQARSTRPARWTTRARRPPRPVANSKPRLKKNF